MPAELNEYTFTVTKQVVVRAYTLDDAFRLAIDETGETHEIELRQVSRVS
jgi:hypothetical protein